MTVNLFLISECMKASVEYFKVFYLKFFMFRNHRQMHIATNSNKLLFFHMQVWLLHDRKKKKKVITKCWSHLDLALNSRIVMTVSHKGRGGWTLYLNILIWKDEKTVLSKTGKRTSVIFWRSLEVLTVTLLYAGTQRAQWLIG